LFIYHYIKVEIKKNPSMPARSLIIMKITGVYECQPGPKAGSKIL